jgi:hypothetical protein
MTSAATGATRADLLAHVDAYLAALGANDPSALPAAPGARFTENGQALALGTGLWATASGVSGEPYVVTADEQSGQAAVIAVVADAGEPAVLGARLAAGDAGLTALETVICRHTGAIFDPAGYGAPAGRYREPLAPAARRSRSELVAIVDGYFEAIERDDASALAVTDDWVRKENGVQTTLLPGGSWGEPLTPAEEQALSRLFAMNVADQIDAGWLRFIADVVDRRYPLVDEERGVVLAAVVFDIPGGSRRVHLGKGIDQEAPYPPFARDTSSMLMLELFHVTDGRIDQIDAVFDFFPYGMRSGWAGGA